LILSYPCMWLLRYFVKACSSLCFLTRTWSPIKDRLRSLKTRTGYPCTGQPSAIALPFFAAQVLSFASLWFSSAILPLLKTTLRRARGANPRGISNAKLAFPARQ
jgi:hypothetical protein